jgi:hypothetical protein
MSAESSDLSELSLVTPLRPTGWERSGSNKERLVGVEALIAVHHKAHGSPGLPPRDRE